MSLSSSSLPAETGGADGDRLAALAGCSHECPASPRARCQLKAHELSAFSRTGLQVQQAMLGGDLASKGHIGWARLAVMCWTVVHCVASVVAKRAARHSRSSERNRVAMIRLLMRVMTPPPAVRLKKSSFTWQCRC